VTVSNFRKALYLLPGLLLFPILVVGGVVGYIASRSLASSVPVVAADATREEQWAQDIDFLVQFLPSNHADAFYVADEEDWFAFAEDIRENIGTLTDDEITFRLMQLVGRVGDGHTGIALTGIGDDLWNDYNYPLRLAYFDDGLFVVQAAYEAQSAIGTSLIAVNGFSVDEIVTRLDDSLYYDEGNQYGRFTSIEALFIRPARLYLGGIVSDLTQATFTFLSADGEEFDLSLNTYETIPDNDFTSDDRFALPVYRTYEREDRDVWFMHLPESDAVYLQYNDAQVDFFEFITTATQAMQTAIREDADKFIIDVRNNRGGSDLPFLLFHYRLQQTSLNVYGIMSRYTFSSGFSVIADLSLSDATIVGQPAGTRPNFFGNVLDSALPNSGLTLFYPTTIGMKFEEYGDAPLFLPDIPVPFTSADFFAGRDPYLEAILNP
jgi:hypothetical protein